jgi:hypothetical protein
MEYSKIKSLADKFLQGQSTEQEEQQLKDALLQEGTEWTGELKEVAELLWFFEAEKQQLQLDEDFDARIMQLIREEPKAAKVVSLNIRKWYWVAAASIIVLIGLVVSLQQPTSKPMAAELDTFDDPMEAYMETKRALMFMSAQMNQGMSHLEEIKEFDKARQMVQP